MTENKKQKQLARARVSKTGESYAAALRQVRAKQRSAEVPEPICLVCGLAQSDDPARVFVVGDEIVICQPCARRVNGLAERAEDGQVLRLMDRNLHEANKTAVAWALKSGTPLGAGLAARMADGELSLTGTELDEIRSEWETAGRPAPDVGAG